jgi:hypothetical protein
VWALCWLAGLFAIVRARRSGRPEDELHARRGLLPVVAVEHAALLAALVSGAVLMQVLGLGVGQRRWLDLKLGVVAFVLVPLEAMHAWVSHGWIARGLAETAAPPFSRDLERGIGMDDMVRTLSALLLGAAVPLVVWLSVREPF